MSHSLSPPNDPLADQHADQLAGQGLTKLRAHIKGAIKFLTKTRLAANLAGTLSSLPWCILLGPENAGKTSLLAHSEQDFVLAKKSYRINLLAPKPTQYCDWWATKQVVYADLSGSFTSRLVANLPKESWFALSATEPTSHIWRETVRLLKGYYKKNKHVAVVVIISAADLTKGKDSSLAKSISMQLNDLRKSFSKPFAKPFPLYLIINKLDELTGFNEFFYDLSQEERSQPWGFRCSDLTQAQTGDCFEQLLAKLNSQLLFRMQSQAQLFKRAAIYEFPTTLANLKPQLLNFLTQTITNDLHWHSIHLASGASRLTPTIKENKVPAAQGKPFFVEHLLQNLVMEQSQVKKQSQIRAKSWYQLGSYLLAGLCISLAAATWAYQFNQQLANIQRVEKSIAEYNALDQLQTTPTLSTKIKLLDSLRQAGHLPYKWFLAKRVKTLQITAHATYVTALQKLLLPELIAQLEQQLNKPTAVEPDQLYASLRAYLMLKNSLHSKTELLLAALASQVHTLEPDLQQSLHQHLQNLLAKPLPALSLNTALIEAARLRLSRLTVPNRAYVIVKNQQACSPYSVLQLPQASIQISTFFTLTSLQHFYMTALAQACHEAVTGNWVLGQLTPPEPMDQSDQVILAAKVSDVYLSDYAHEWQRVLSEISDLTWLTVANLSPQLEALLAKNSALNQALQLIDKQTRVQEFTQGYSRELAQRLTEKFASLHNLLTEPDQWQSLQLKIRSLQIYLLQLQINGDQQAYNMAKTYILAPSAPNPMVELLDYAKQLPNPWHSWLEQIANVSWQLVAKYSQAYLQQLWQQQVLNFFNEKISTGFPFNSNAQQDVSLADFSEFFKPQGILDGFFNRYLRPFIDTSDIPWQPRHLTNPVLTLNPQTLTALQQAAIIQRMFYPTGEQQPSFSYTLTPLALDARISSLSLTINGHELTYPSDTASLSVTWADNPDSSQARLSYQDKSGSHLLLDYKGPWSLFRLLQQGSLQTTKDPKRFILTLNINDQAVQFELKTQQPLSPFTRDILNGYFLPHKL